MFWMGHQGKKVRIYSATAISAVGKPSRAETPKASVFKRKSFSHPEEGEKTKAWRVSLQTSWIDLLHPLLSSRSGGNSREMQGIEKWHLAKIHVLIICRIIFCPMDWEKKCKFKGAVLRPPVSPKLLLDWT